MTTAPRVVLVVDAGQDIIGILSVATNNYTAYRGADMVPALALIAAADELVTYNGDRYDLGRLKAIGELYQITFAFSGRHSDMQRICWPNILGSNLRNTYTRYFPEATLSCFPDTYEGSNWCDTHMTLKLWELWQNGKLENLSGPIVSPDAA